MCGCDYDPPKFYHSNIVKARKRHDCCECLRTIEKGESYQVATGLWERDLETFKTCDQCLGLIRQLDDCCFCHRTLREYAWQPECDGEDWKKFRERLEEGIARIKEYKLKKEVL